MRKILSITAISMVAVASNGWGAEGGDLEKQVRELVRQNRMLIERVTDLEKRLEIQESPAKRHYGQPAVVDQEGQAGEVDEDVAVLGSQEQGQVAEEPGPSILGDLRDRVELGALVEVESNISESFDNEDAGDITLATVEIGLDARISSWSDAHLVFLYEGGEEDEHVLLDEGTITLSDSEKIPAYLTLGKMYLPFGSYESNMISDSLPLEIGEINDTAALVGFEARGFSGAIFVFNGDINETDKEDTIDVYGASLGYVHECERLSFRAGVDWMNNIADTDGLGDNLSEREVDDADQIDDYVEGVALHLQLDYGAFSFMAEYVAALDAFQSGEIAFGNRGAEPEAWSYEIGMTCQLLDRETVFALGYQGTDEALAFELPEDRYLAAVRMYLFENTSLALEYLYDKDYDKSEDGSGNHAHSATMQLAVEF
ncbi:MAG: LbtU family siderophore porin [Pseudomonadota bacterium]